MKSIRIYLTKYNINNDIISTRNILSAKKGGINYKDRISEISEKIVEVETLISNIDDSNLTTTINLVVISIQKLLKCFNKYDNAEKNSQILDVLIREMNLLVDAISILKDIYSTCSHYEWIYCIHNFITFNVSNIISIVIGIHIFILKKQNKIYYMSKLNEKTHQQNEFETLITFFNNKINTLEPCEHQKNAIKFISKLNKLKIISNLGFPHIINNLINIIGKQLECFSIALDLFNHNLDTGTSLCSFIENSIKHLSVSVDLLEIMMIQIYINSPI